MKIVTTILVTVVLLTGGVGSIALDEDPESIDNNNEDNEVASIEKSFTHPVFAEFGTATWCKYCKYAHAALKNLYAGGWHPFYYVSLVTDVNTHAYSRAINNYNIRGYPSVYFDGGYKLQKGTFTDVRYQMERYNESIESCGDRAVPDISVNLSVEWIWDATMNINVTVQNNETSDYNGHIRVYVTEISSSMGWDDTGGHPYTFAFLDYAFNEDVQINPDDIWHKSKLWIGEEHNNGHGDYFGNITYDNIMVIATVFNATWHQGYSDPPDGNPFDAYYVDDVATAIPIPDNYPPDKPSVNGSKSGVTDVEYEYTFTAIDPEGEDFNLFINWGDGNTTGWTEFVPSGTEVNFSHVWAKEDKYKIKVKAKDIGGHISYWSNPFVVQIGPNKVGIGKITGGIGVIKAEVENILDDDITDIEWSISIKGGVLGRINIETEGIIDAILTDDKEIISTDKLIFGLGWVNISVAAGYDYQTAQGFVLGPLLIILN